MATERSTSPLIVEVSDDRMSVMCRVDPGGTPCPVAVAEIASALQKLGVRFDNNKLDELLPTGFLAPQQSVEVARGRAPVNAAPARIELPEMPSATSEGSAGGSHYDRHSLRIVAADEPMATYYPAVRGRDGVDVFGKPVAYKPDSRPGDTLGHNIMLLPDGVTVVAVRAGVVRFEHGRLSVEPELTIPGNVDFSTGNIEFPGNVHIAGNILDLFKVDVAGDVDVAGAIEAAEVLVRGSLQVRGGITGKDKCVCRVGKDLSARYITNATVRVGGDVIVQSEIANSRVAATGLVRVDNGAIIAGRMAAAGGIRCGIVGSSAAVATLLEVGIDMELLDRCTAQTETMEARRKQAQQIRQTVEPLMRQQKRLTAAQKEKATELLYNADEMDRQFARAARELEQHALTFQANSRAELVVSRTIHVGTIVRFARVEAVISTTLAGPLRIVCSSAGSERRVMVIGHNGSSYALPSRPVQNKILDALARLGAASAAAAA